MIVVGSGVRHMAPVQSDGPKAGWLSCTVHERLVDRRSEASYEDEIFSLHSSGINATINPGCSAKEHADMHQASDHTQVHTL